MHDSTVVVDTGALTTQPSRHYRTRSNPHDHPARVRKRRDDYEGRLVRLPLLPLLRAFTSFTSSSSSSPSSGTGCEEGVG